MTATEFHNLFENKKDFQLSKENTWPANILKKSHKFTMYVSATFIQIAWEGFFAVEETY